MVKDDPVGSIPPNCKSNEDAAEIYQRFKNFGFLSKLPISTLTPESNPAAVAVAEKVRDIQNLLEPRIDYSIKQAGDILAREMFNFKALKRASKVGKTLTASLTSSEFEARVRRSYLLEGASLLKTKPAKKETNLELTGFKKNVSEDAFESLAGVAWKAPSPLTQMKVDEQLMKKSLSISPEDFEKAVADDDDNHWMVDVRKKIEESEVKANANKDIADDIMEEGLYGDEEGEGEEEEGGEEDRDVCIFLDGCDGDRIEQAKQRGVWAIIGCTDELPPSFGQLYRNSLVNRLTEGSELAMAHTAALADATRELPEWASRPPQLKLMFRDEDYR